MSVYDADAELPSVTKHGDLSYNDYLKVPELLELQQPVTDPSHHDEMLFIIIHQAYELWFKLILHEVDQAIVSMNAGAVLQARHFVNRVVEILRLLVQQIHILETMRPVDFLQFRDRLNPASGFQSVQFRALEFAAGLKDPSYLRFFKNRPELQAQLERALEAPDLRITYYEMLRRQGFALPAELSIAHLDADEADRQQLFDALMPIYHDPEDHLPLSLLTQSLIDLDHQLQLWRQHHVGVVARIIGHKRGTGGSAGVAYLESTTSKKAFPFLWEVRTYLEK